MCCETCNLDILMVSRTQLLEILKVTPEQLYSNGTIYNVVYFFTYLSFFLNNCEKKSYFLKSLIYNEKGNSHFKITTSEYNYPDVYLQNCEEIVNWTLLATSWYCLKVGMLTTFWIWSLPSTFVTQFRNVITKLNFIIIHIHKITYD